MEATYGEALKTVVDVYNGPECTLWKLIMGEQIHIGGMASSMALAEKAGIAEGSNGVDLCACLGAGMRFLTRFRGTASMIGVDATERVIREGEEMNVEENVADKISFVKSDVCNTPLDADSADFVWGEDAWCYVDDKNALIAEAARIVKSDGVVAFTDWVEGPAGLSDDERERFCTFMKFPNVESIQGYSDLLAEHGLSVEVAEDTQQFAPHVDLYLNMLNMQLTYDALKIIGFDQELMGAMAGEMMFMQELAHAGKIAQGRFVARKA